MDWIRNPNNKRTKLYDFYVRPQLKARRKSRPWGTVPMRYARKGRRTKYGGKYSPIELQIHQADTSLLPAAIVPGGSTTNSTSFVKMQWLNSDFKVGSGYNERKGRDVVIRSTTIDIMLYYNSAADEQISMIPVDIFIVHDTQVNGAAIPSWLSIRDVFNDGTVSVPSLSNIDNSGRFKILKKIRVTPKNYHNFQFSTKALTIYLKNNISVRYNASSTLGENYSELDRGGLLMFMVPYGPVNTLYNSTSVTPVLQYQWSARFSYTS